MRIQILGGITMTSNKEPKSRVGQYHILRTNQGPEAARELVRTVLKEQKGDVAETARILGITRPTVRRARDGDLSDGDKTPLNQPAKTETYLEGLILKTREDTGYGRKRLSNHLIQTLGLNFSSNTIGNILGRHPVKKQLYKRPGISKPLYDYEALLPFQELQIDTKHIEDYGALGKMVFNLRKYHLPPYQWTVIDAKTKTKFLAYSYTLSSQYGIWFMQMVVFWLRAHGITTDIHFQADNGGADFAGGSKRKEEMWNKVLNAIGSSFTSIPAGKKYLQGIVERTHRTDDEEFYRPHLPRLDNREDFLVKAQRYQDTFNVLRQHWGIGMNGKSPLDKLRECETLGAEKLIAFPVVIIDEIFDGVKTLNDYVRVRQMSEKGGKDVSTHYH